MAASDTLIQITTNKTNKLLYADKDPITEKTPSALNSIPRKIVIKCVLRTHIKTTPKMKMKKLKSSINFITGLVPHSIKTDIK